MSKQKLPETFFGQTVTVRSEMYSIKCMTTTYICTYIYIYLHFIIKKPCATFKTLKTNALLSKNPLLKREDHYSLLEGPMCRI